MFISNRKHLAIVQEIRYYWSNELDRVRSENRRLKAQLEAKAAFEAAQETPFPASLPVFSRPWYGIMHVASSDPRKTLCGELIAALWTRNTAEVGHGFTDLTPQQTKLKGNESWCADCLG